MAENLNEYLCSVFTREDISVLSVPETKFQRERERVGQFRTTNCKPKNGSIVNKGYEG